MFRSAVQVVFLLSLLNLHIESNPIEKSSSKILIIGAGLAGQSAAVKLIENGFENLEIFEAENRTGGRVR